VKDGGKLTEKLDALEKKMWQSPEGIGIRPDIDAQSSLYGAFDVQSSWEPPTPNDRAKLARAHKAVQSVVDELNKLFAGDVAAYRKKAEEAKAGCSRALPRSSCRRRTSGGPVVSRRAPGPPGAHRGRASESEKHS
jgi:hypothetical protein